MSFVGVCLRVEDDILHWDGNGLVLLLHREFSYMCRAGLTMHSCLVRTKGTQKTVGALIADGTVIAYYTDFPEEIRYKTADSIVVIENGEVIEAGTHNELIAHKGTYATLYTMQAEYYQ